MNCEFCGAELYPAIAHVLIGGITSQPAQECRKCYAIYDLEGHVLEGPIDDSEYTEPPTEHDERGPFMWQYGHFGGGDPRDFQPDMELCTPEEVARWKADVARAEAGEDVIAPPAGQWNESGTIHILAPKYGIGTYKMRFDDDDESEAANG